MRERYKKGSLIEENSGWWLRYTERHTDGKISRPRVFIGTKEQYPTKRKAQLAADKVMEGVNEAVAVTRFEHLCDRYKESGISHLREYTAKNYGSHIRIMREAFGKERIDFLASPQGILKIEAWLNGQKITASYRKQHKSCLSLMFKYAMKAGYLVIGANPMTLVDVHNLPHNTTPRRKRNVITAEQYHALQGDPLLYPMDKLIISVMELTGMRGCEALGLKWEDVAYGESKIYVRRSVKGKYIDDPKTLASKRTVYLPDGLANMLRRWKAEQPVVNDWLFGSVQTGRPFTACPIRKRIKEAAKRLGFDYEGMGLHSHRHTFRANLRDAGATSEEQMWALGHTNLPTTMRYGQDGIDRAAKLAGPVSKVVSILGKTGTNNA